MIETAKQAGMEIPKRAVPRRSARTEPCRQKYPKWQDADCKKQFREIQQTSNALKSDPKNQYLRAKIITENKSYKRLIKFKQKQFSENLFSQLESMHKTEPKKYMELVNSLKTGSFDRSKQSDTAAISPEEWFSHFSTLLCKPSRDE